MRKILLSLFSLFIIGWINTTSVKGQVASYAFSQSSSTYTPITGGTVLATPTGNTAGTSLDDAIYNIASFPFAFTFNGVAYTSCNVSTNGFITFGATASAVDNYEPINSTEGYEGAISVFGGDLNSFFNIGGRTGELRWETIGTAPNREIVIQWKDWRARYSTSATNVYGMNYQIRLFEDSNIIRIVYGGGSYAAGSTAITLGTRQIGLRGLTNVDFNNRVFSTFASASTAGTLNSSTNNYNTNTNIPASGLSLRWTPPSCIAPSALNIASLAITSVTLNWTASPSAPANGYEWEVRTSGAGGSGAVGLTASGSVGAGVVTENITGLTSATTYIYYVRSNCGGTFSGWVASSPFTTTCPPTNVPYTQDFESVITPAIPVCTSVLQAGTGNLWATSSPAGFGFTTKALRYLYNGTNAANTWFFTQSINLTGGTSYRISYKYGNSSGTTFPEKLKVAYGVSATVAGMTTTLADYPNVVNNNAITATMDFTPASTGVYYFGFQAYSDADQDALFIDDISVIVTPTCFVPTALNTTAINTTTTTINWTASAPTPPANGYEWEVRTSGLGGSGAVGLVTSGSVGAGVVTANITGLTANTTYTFYVRGNCNGVDFSTWVASSSFTTLCNPTNVPYTQDFESVTTPAIPVCTSVLQAGTGNLWATNSPANFGFTTKALRYLYNISNAANTWFFIQGINLTGGTSYRISYKYGNSGATTFPEKLKVAYGTSASVAGMTNTLADYPNVVNNNAITATTDFIPASTGVYYFGFQAYSLANQDGLFIDDISITLTPSCFAPSALNITAIATTTATLNWTASAPTPPANGYEWEVRTSGLGGSGAVGLVTSGSVGAGVVTANITGLTANTTYTFYVRGNCNGVDFSTWVASSSFTTPCNAVNIPYLQDFESVTPPAIPNCTSVLQAGAGNLWETISSPSASFTNNTLRYGYNGANAANVWYFTQGLNLTAGTSYRVSYKYGNNSTFFTEKLKVAYGTSPTAASMTNNLADHPNININGALNNGVDFVPASTGVYYVGFQAYSIANQFNLFLDDINITLTPSCFAPSALNTTNLGINTVTLNWTASAPTPPANGYEWEVRTSGAGGSGVVGLAASGSVGAGIVTANATGLTQNTIYTFYVRGNCGGVDFSTWTASGTFTTLLPPLTYTFSQNNIGYIEITGGTLINSGDESGTFDDQMSTEQTIPSFTYNGVAYTSMFVSDNGYIKLGTVAPINTYNPLSATDATLTNIIAPFGRDLGGVDATSELRWEQIGNRIIIQWKNVRRYGITGESFDFQIQLNISNNTIRFLYGAFTPLSGANPQIGLRGATNVWNNQVINRTNQLNWDNTTSGSANNSTVTLVDTPTLTAPVSGLTYIYTPGTCGMFPIIGTTTQSGINTVVNWTVQPDATDGYDVRYRLQSDPITSYTVINVPGQATNTLNIPSLTLNGTYIFEVRKRCSSTTFSEYSNASIFTIPAPKAITAITVTQASTSVVGAGSTNQAILGTQFNVTGSLGTLPLNSIKFTTQNTADADVTNVKLYSTTTNVFSIANPLGTAQNIFAGEVTFTGLGYDLPAGNTYIWLTYDIASSATSGNTVDARILANNINVNGTTYNAGIENPAGNRVITNEVATVLCDNTNVTCAYNRVNTIAGTNCSTVGTLSIFNTAIKYQVVKLNTNTTGIHSVAATLGTLTDTFIALYCNSFDPNTPLVNLFAANDDNGVDNGSLLSGITLNAGTDYYVVTGSFDNTLVGTHTLTFTGPIGSTVTAIPFAHFANVTTSIPALWDGYTTNSPRKLVLSGAVNPNGMVNVTTDLEYANNVAFTGSTIVNMGNYSGKTSQPFSNILSGASVVPGNTYYYRVRVPNICGGFNYSAVQTYTVPMSEQQQWRMLNFSGSQSVTATRPVQDAFTIEFWFKTSNAGVTGATNWTQGTGLIDATTGANRADFGVSMSDGKIFAGTRDVAGATFNITSTNNNLNDNKWHHVAFRRSTTNVLSLLIDGKSADDTNPDPVMGADVLNASALVTIGGKSNNTNRFNGQIDEVRFWNTGLSNNAIREHLHLELLGKINGNVYSAHPNASALQAYYQLNEASGNFASDIAPAVNATAKGYTATLNGFTSGFWQPYTSPIGKVGYTSGVLSVPTVGVAGKEVDNIVGVTLDFANGGTATDGDVHITMIMHNPESLPTLGMSTNSTSAYWIIHNFGTVNSGLALDEISFKLPSRDVISSTDETTPSNLRMFKRADNESGAASWNNMTGATIANNTTKKVQFTGAQASTITGFSQIVIASQTSPLPVRMMTFSGTRINTKENKLQWATATEENNRGFEVERSLDGQAFTKVGFVDGAGNSANIRNYSFVDRNIATSAYYRLRQVENNSTNATYSNVIFIDADVTSSSVVLYPNPTRGEVNIEVSEYIKNLPNIRTLVTDIKGTKVMEYTGNWQNTQNVFNKEVPQFGNGTYIIRFVTEKRTFTIKLVKE